MLSPLIDVLTVLHTLYNLGTTEEGEQLSLKQEDFYSHKLMNKITKQLQVRIKMVAQELLHSRDCVSLGPPGVVQWVCTHMVSHHMHNVSHPDTVQRTPELVPLHSIWHIQVSNCTILKHCSCNTICMYMCI